MAANLTDCDVANERLTGLRAMTSYLQRCKIDVVIRTQVQLPDELYEKAKRFSREREMSLAEVVRRGLELFLDRYPPPGTAVEPPWVLPTFDGGGILVPLDELHDLSADDETFRSFPSDLRPD